MKTFLKNINRNYNVPDCFSTLHSDIKTNTKTKIMYTKLMEISNKK